MTVGLTKGNVAHEIMKNWDKFLSDLAKIIAIPSVQGKALRDAPFGKEPRNALLMAMTIAQGYGFETKLVNDAVAYAQFGPDRPDGQYIGIIGHLDVVPADEGDWISDPFVLTQRQDILYARGILDNKGPIMSCLYGLKIIKEMGYHPQVPIRILFGSNEETGSQDIPLYLAKELPPIFGFTPDCKYPVVYGERGIVNVEISVSINDAELHRFSDIEGYQSRSVVPSDLSVSFDGKFYRAIGKSSPSNAPELGVNSITELAKQLCSVLPKGELLSYFTWVDRYLSDDYYGENLGIDFSDEASGKLILTPVKLQKTLDGMLKLELAIRYPISILEDDIFTGIQKKLPENAMIKTTRSLKSSQFPPDNVYVNLLSDVYGEVTGLDTKPVTTTGATYARYMPNIVAFGPSFPGQKGIAHKENEYFLVSDLRKNMLIYTLAIYKLCQMTYSF